MCDHYRNPFGLNPILVIGSSSSYESTSSQTPTTITQLTHKQPKQGAFISKKNRWNLRWCPSESRERKIWSLILWRWNINYPILPRMRSTGLFPNFHQRDVPLSSEHMKYILFLTDKRNFHFIFFFVIVCRYCARPLFFFLPSSLLPLFSWFSLSLLSS